jgi:outer membrane receptor protein involved in Fe transport
MMKAFLLGATSLASGAVVLALASAAHAQTASGAAEAGVVEEVVVTGSRISRRDYVADSPVVSVGQSAIQAAGPATLEGVLNELPQFTAIRPGSTLTGSRQGRNNANLRGLGIARTLVLLDGRRMQPSDSLGTIDLNTIPSSLIENVEVITGGASAVYGSDAIAGVVNFKLRRSFQGLEVDAQYGQTGRNDAESFETTVTTGGDIAEGRGHIDLALGYLTREYTPRGARSFFKDSGIASNLTGALIQGDATNLPSQAALTALFGSYGAAAPARNATFSINPDGTVFTATSPVLNYRVPPGGIYTLVNGRVGIAYGETYALQAPLERFNVFGRASYDLTDNVEAYAQVSHVQYTTQFNVFGGSVRELTIPSTNPFIPADLRRILDSRARPTAPLVYNFSSGRVGRSVTDTDYTVDQYLAGLRGRLPVRDWKWEAYASYGRTDQDARTSGRIDRAAINALINAPDGGRSLCSGGFNPFSPLVMESDPAQQACYNYVHRTVRQHTTFEQSVAEATLQGGLFTLPAGELRFAAGASYRKNEFDDEPPSEVVNATLVNAVAGQITPTHGSIDVKELFAEVLVPVVKDLPFVKAFDIDLAYRYSSYSSIGPAHTYKASGDWKVNDVLSFRGGFQQAIRAPSLGEIFARDGGGQGLIGSTASGAGDPCDITGVYRRAGSPNAARVRDLCIANGIPANIVDIYRFTGSSVPTRNPVSLGLNEERARTYTLGAIVRSPFSHPLLSNLSASVDYYRIKVTDAIGTITAPINLSQCFNANGSNPDYSAGNVFCQQIVRDPNGNIFEILTPRLNLASYKTSGVDVQVDWAAGLEDFGLDAKYGRVSVNLLVSYLESYAIQNLKGQTFVDYAGTIGNAQIDEFTISYPRWKASASINYDVGPAQLSLKTRWIDDMFNSQDAGAATKTRPGVNSRMYFDLTGRWQAAKGLEFRGGMLNIADTQPPVWTGEGATDLALYDVLGRRFYVGVRKTF